MSQCETLVKKKTYFQEKFLKKKWNFKNYVNWSFMKINQIFFT